MTAPFIFNPWKHHAGRICRSLEKLARFAPGRSGKLLKSRLLLIGDNNLDLYIGCRGPAQIFGEIREHLQIEMHFEEEQFVRWLAWSGGYQKVTIGDDSSWILQAANNSRRYLHIHPAKYAPHTIRCRAATLKTAILVLHHLSAGQKPLPPVGEAVIPDKQSINALRKELAGLPPLQNFAAHSAVSRLVELLRKTAVSPVAG